MERFDRSYVRKIRYAFQWGLFALIIYGGFKLYLFAGHFSTGRGALIERPPLVDGFLPIGALMALKLWVAEGIFDAAHPSALVIFLGAVAVSTVLKKGFCGWICPVGTLSEAVYKSGKRIFGRNFRINKYADYALRSIKYILMAFFLYIVMVKMSPPAIRGFLETPYWKVADIKMLLFFTEMSALTAVALALLFGLSLLYKNFWCRYLCPYGALLGLLSFLSPLKITRDEGACIHCGACTRNCPSLLPVEDKKRVRSPECTGCLTCLSGCPAKGALDVALPKKGTLRPFVYIVLVAVIFFGIIGAAKIAGKWHSNISYEDYKALVPAAGKFEHP
jgi:polyferredoxin